VFGVFAGDLLFDLVCIACMLGLDVLLRGLDVLGEIAVLFSVGIGLCAMLT